MPTWDSATGSEHAPLLGSAISYYHIKSASHLHVHDDLVVGCEEALVRLAGGGVEVVPSHAGGVVDDDRDAAGLRLQRARALMVRVHPAGTCRRILISARHAPHHMHMHITCFTANYAPVISFVGSLCILHCKNHT